MSEMTQPDAVTKVARDLGVWDFPCPEYRANPGEPAVRSRGVRMSDQAEVRCRFVAKDQPRAVVGEHYDDCAGDCKGCWPCALNHCLTCGRAHVEANCTDCLHDARDDLRAIVALSGFPLLEEVLSSGEVDSDAAMLVGPVAVPSKWQRRAARAMLGRASDAYLEDCRDEDHPQWVLWWIEEEWREAFNDPSDELATVTGSAAYIDRMLHIVANTLEMPGGSQPPEFADARRKLAAARLHLENVLSEGERDERGAPCPTCRTEGEKPRPLVKRYSKRDLTGASDRWVCQRNGSHWWSEADYRLRVGQDHIEHAEVLTATDMVRRTRVPAGTIRRWAAKTTLQRDGEIVEVPPRLKLAGRSEDGRNLYRVADVLALRDAQSADVA